MWADFLSLAHDALDVTGVTLFVEARYHFFFDSLRDLPGMDDGSTFTAVFRWERVNLDKFKTQRFTLGINLRPVEETVIKFEYQWNDEFGDKADVDDDTFLASIATYF